MAASAQDEPSTIIDEDARRRFEAAWKAGRPEPIERHLPAPESPSYDGTLEELVLIELEFGWKAHRKGELTAAPPRVEDYLKRFPGLDRPDLVPELLKHEFLTRRRLGDPVDPAEYRSRFPQLQFSGDDWQVTVQRARPTLDEKPQVPGYEVLEMIGRGGMGVVFKAVHSRLGRVVALKQVLSGPLASDEDLQRFQTEASAVAQMQHSGIVQIYEIGESQGRPFIALEFVEGGTLAEKLAGNPISGQQAAALAAPLARALQAVHERGILHRDLKPGNILLTADGHPKITDFGLAKRVEAAGVDSDAPSLTQTGAIVGTPCYMAPEQAAGKSKEVGAAADIYSLGAILYEMLTGRPPFKAETPMETVFQVLEQEPVPPRRMQPKVPRDLETICLKCLEKEPHRRYASAQALAEDLDHFLADEPIQARPVSRLERGWRWCRRKPVLAGLLAFSAVAVLGAVVGLFFWQDEYYQRQQQLHDFGQQKQLDELRRKERLHAAAEQNRTLAMSELKANRFASAEKFLATAVGNLKGEEGMEDLSAPISTEHDRVRRLVDFYRYADRAERLAFFENDSGALGACRASLERLGVVQAKGSWWLELPDKELSPSQAAKLQRDANHQLMLLCGLLLLDEEEAKENKTVKNAQVYEAVLALTDKIQKYHEANQLGPSIVAHILQSYCYFMQGSVLKIRRLGNIDPSTASDCYYLGIGHSWLAQSSDDWISKAISLTFRVLGVNMGPPASAGQRLLRRAASEDGTHYWTHFWLGWALVADNNPAGAELAFTTCITLRPEEGAAYAERMRCLSLQAAVTKDAQVRDEILRRCRADAARALKYSPNEWYAYYPVLDSCARLGWKKEGLEAAGRMIDLMPPVRLLRVRSRDEQAVLLKYVSEYLTEQAKKGDDAETLSLLGRIALRLSKEPATDLQAVQLAEKALQLDSTHPRARILRAIAAMRKKEMAAALADFQAAAAKDPNNFLAGFGQARIHEMEKRWELAATGYEAVLPRAKAEWQRIEVYLGRWRVLTQLGRLQEAGEAMAQAREIDPDAAELSVATRTP